MSIAPCERNGRHLQYTVSLPEMDRLDAMAVFVAVAERQGFAAAARQLKRSAPMVTRAVASLEAGLGVRLLQRTTRSVTLTDAGRAYLTSARGILAEVARADDAAKAQKTVPSGRFVVSAPVLFGKLHVAPVMTRFLLKHAEVRGELLLQDRPVSLVEEGVDVAVRIGVLKDSSLVARKVGQTARVVVSAPKYRGTARIQVTALGGGPDAAFVTNQAEVALAHAVAGGGIAELLSYQCAAAVEAGKLTVQKRGEPLPIHCVTPSGRLQSAATRAFVDLAAAQAWRF